MTKNTRVPLMVSVLLAFGAWFSCLLMILCFSLSALRQSWIAGGIYICFAAVLAHACEKAKGIGPAGAAFLTQLSLAFSLLGKCLLIIGIAEIFDFQAGATFILTLFVAVGSYRVFTQNTDRIFTIAGAGFVGMAWLVEVQMPSLTMECLGIFLFLISYVLFLLKKETLRSLAWGLLLVSAGPMLMMLEEQTRFAFSGVGQIFLGMGLVAVYAWQAGKQFCVSISAAILVLVYLTNLGTGIGVALLCLGFIQKSLYHKIAGVFIFAVGLIWLYYHMQVSLLVKSYYLMGTGLILLSGYACLKRGQNAR